MVSWHLFFKQIKRAVPQFVLIFLLCLSCAPQNSTPTPQPVSLTFACPADQVKTYQQAAEDFHRENLFVQVHVLPLDEIVSFPLDETDLFGPVEKLAAAADVFAWTDDGVEGGPTGLVLDLAPFVKSDEQMAEEAFLPGLLAHFQWQGGTWAIPAWVHAPLVAYDARLFEQADLDEPQPGWTWDDLALAAEKLTRREGAQTIRYGAYLGINPALSVLDAQGGRLVDEMREVAVPLLDDPHTVAAAQWYVDLVRRGIVLDPTNSVDPINLLKKGEIALSVLPSGVWTDDLAHENEAFKLTALPGRSRVYPYGYYISAGTAHPQAAWQWVQFLSREVVPADGLPARPEQAADAPGIRRMGEQAAQAVQDTLSRALLPVRPVQIERQFMEAVERILGGMDAQTALAQAQQTALTGGEPAAVETVVVPPPTPTPAATEQIVFFAQITGGYPQLAGVFQQEHPEIQIKFVSARELGANQSSFGLNDLIQTTQADCFLWNSGMLQNDENRSLVLDLGPFVDAYPDFAPDDFVPVAWAHAYHNGNLRAIPAGLRARVLYYNRALFQAANEPFPQPDWTWDDLIGAAYQLSGGEPPERQYGLLLWPFGQEIRTWVEAWAGSLVDTQGAPARFRFDDPQIVSAVRQLARLVQDRVVPALGMETITVGDQQHTAYQIGELEELARAQKGAMWLEWVGLIHQNSIENVSVALPPASVAGSGLYVASQYYISAQTSHASACWAWIRFLSTQIPPDGTLPPRYSLLRSKQFAEQVGQANQQVYLRAAESPFLSSPAPEGWPEKADRAYTWFDRALENVLWQVADVETELAQAQFKADAYLACLRRQTEQDVAAAQACFEQVEADAARP